MRQGIQLSAKSSLPLQNESYYTLVIQIIKEFGVIRRNLFCKLQYATADVKIKQTFTNCVQGYDRVGNVHVNGVAHTRKFVHGIDSSVQ